jgi:hypothetical protein
VSFACRELPDVEAEEVKADVPFVFVEGVCDVGLFGFESQAHFGEPFFGAALGFQQRRQVVTQDDEVG